ncbi:MAG TPA: dienelactone hydrolase family protein [Pyrinomonadaceae bacterium]
MCTTESCIEDENVDTERRSFLTGATVAVVGAALGLKTSAQQPPQPPTGALTDGNVIQNAVSFKSGPDTIEGYLARPRQKGRYRAVVVLHGNLFLPEDHRYTAAQLGQAGFVGLAVRRFSRTPDLTIAELNRSDREDQRYLSNTFNEQELRDARAAIEFLRSEPYVRGTTVGMVGFCGGGYQSLLLSSRSKDISAVVAFYAPPILQPQYQNPNDPKPNLMDIVGSLKTPIQGHYGTADAAIPVEDVRRFEQALKKQKTPSEIFYYEGAGHGFCDYTRRNYNPEAAALAKERMLQFLKRQLK